MGNLQDDPRAIIADDLSVPQAQKGEPHPLNRQEPCSLSNLTNRKDSFSFQCGTCRRFTDILLGEGREGKGSFCAEMYEEAYE